MKNKIFVMICLTILFSCFYIIPSHASIGALSEYNYVFIIYDVGSSQYRVMIAENAVGGQYSGGTYYLTLTKYSSVVTSSSNLAWCEQFVEQYWNSGYAFASINNATAYYSYNYLHVYKGNISGTLKPDSILPEPPPEPTWWDNVKDAFMDFVGSDAMSAVISGDWLSYLDEVLFGGLWTIPVGEGEDELVEFYTVSATPSPSPSPTPTQIPVQINIDPDTGNVTYHYNIIVSGTPIPTSSPVNPNPPVSGGGDGGSGLSEPVGVEDYYEPDDSLSIPNLRIFQFQLDLPGSTTDIGVDSLDNNFEVMNGYLEDNSEAITTVSSFFQVIPSEWFLLLGAIACFPIIAAMIKSLLGG